jgi:hypothetical protein
MRAVLFHKSGDLLHNAGRAPGRGVIVGFAENENMIATPRLSRCNTSVSAALRVLALAHVGVFACLTRCERRLLACVTRACLGLCLRRGCAGGFFSLASLELRALGGVSRLDVYLFLGVALGHVCSRAIGCRFRDRRGRRRGLRRRRGRLDGRH